MNLFIGIGRLVRDPECRYTESTGKAVTKFAIAIDRKAQQGAEKQADFINCVAFDKRAETVANYFRKGQRIGVEGSLRVSNYTDKQGNKRTAVDVWVNNFEFIEKKEQSSDNGSGFESMGQEVEFSEIPF